jgi:hypothetical protein
MLSKKMLVILLGTIMILSLTGPLMAQDSDDNAQLALDYSKAIQANTKGLMTYSWNERSQVSMEGADVVVILQLIRYTKDGQFQATLLSQEPGRPGGKGPKSKKANAIYDGSVNAATSIPKLLMAYTMLTSGQLVDFFGNGTLSPGDGDMAGTTKIVSSNVLVKGDSVTLYVDMTTMLPRGMDVKTVANEKAIESYLDFGVLEDGTSYLSNAETLIPENGMKILMETFDHKK